MEQTQRGLVIKPMTLNDIDGVMSVELECFTTPWTRESFIYELQNKDLTHYIIAKYRDTVIGYCGIWLILDKAHVTNVGVLPSYRGCGVGEILLRTIITIAKRYKAKTLTLEVRKSNYIAQNLYFKLGFLPCGIRIGYYSDDKEDAIIMTKNLI